jgi:hypothetical protein
MTRRWIEVAALGLTLAGISGCRTTLADCKPPPEPVKVEYALVEYRVGGELTTAPKVEISETPTYRTGGGKFTSVAVRLPDSCLNEGASKVTGVSKEAQMILQTECGPWLAEIERALAGAGFRVMSWDAVWKLEKQKNLSTYNAAKELGAEIVFVFNSLEAANITAGQSKTTSHKYFQSDARGTRGAPLPLDDATRNAFQAYTAQAAGGSIKPNQVIALSSILDSTAIVTGSGESIWFYRRTVVQPTPEKQGMRFLFARLPGQSWLPAAPEAEQPVVTVAAPVLRSEDQGTTEVGASTDTYATERLALIRAGAEHFVSSFRSGKGGS